MGKKKNTPNLGKSIIKSRHSNASRGQHNDSWRHTSELNDGYDWGRLNLSSVTEQSALDEFLTTAELAGTEFTAEKLNIRVIDPQQHTGLPSAEETRAIEEAQQLNKEFLSIPRRPAWDSNTTPDELDLKERDSFLEWRRQLALLQEKEHIVITPFERNLEFWRQLWRVIERSDIIVQIVDARNPLLFRCEDLENYVKEVNKVKENMILISKADLLTPTQRRLWAEYFSKEGVKVAFWSAVSEVERIKNLENQEEEDDKDNDEEVEEEEEIEDEDGDDEVELSNPAAVLQDELQLDNKSTNAAEMDDLASGTEQLSLACSSQLEHSLEGSTQDTIEHGDTSQAQSSSQTQASQDKADDTREVTCISRNTAALADDVNSEQLNASCNSERTNNGNTREDERTDLVHANESDGGKLSESSNRGGAEKVDSSQKSNEACKEVKNDPSLLTGDQLIALLYELHDGKEKVQEGITTVGMVGYPNVGKSSTINALLQQKKVPVSATPGRTKHFQTLFVEPTMCLCDCPGLVMPSFVSTKAEMVINGILPIDQIRDFVPPVSLICQRIPRKVLERVYGINIVKPKEGEDPSRPPTAREFINAYGYMRGFMTHKGLPDGPKSARIVLKDYVKGKLLYCHSPPGIDSDVFKPVQLPTESKPHASGQDRTFASRPLITAEGTKVKLNAGKKLDEAFFNEQASTAHSKGAQGVKGFSRVAGYTSNHAPGMTSNSTVAGIEKPWKKHNNKKRKEKLRRVYKHLDDH